MKAGNRPSDPLELLKLGEREDGVAAPSAGCTVGMVQRGHTDEDIRKILGGNVLRVARAALKDVAGLSPATC